MKCKNCKYRKNIGKTSETGSAICSYSSSWFPVNIENNCHLISEKKELTCGDCSRLGEDTACFDCSEDDSAIYNGQLCRGFVDEREEEFKQILMFWKVQGFYDREKNVYGILLVLRMVVKNFVLYFVMLMILHMVDLRKSALKEQKL